MTTTTTMRAFTGTRVSGALLVALDGPACPEAARGAVRALDHRQQQRNVRTEVSPYVGDTSGPRARPRTPPGSAAFLFVPQEPSLSRR